MNKLQEWAARWGVPYAALVELSRLYEPEFTSVSGGSEAMVQAGLRVEAPKHGNALWRNNNGAHLDETGRLVRYGLGNDSKKLSDVWKSSDLIGIWSRRVEPQHVGQVWGVFDAAEVKEPGWKGPKNEHERAQQNFLMSVESLGGRGRFLTSVEEYRK